MSFSLKLTHLLGLALFLGSLPGHIIIGHFGPDSGIPPVGVVFARHLIQALCLGATLPGLALLLISGLLFWRRERQVQPVSGWLFAHIGLGLAAVVNGAFILTPAVFALTAAAHQLVDGGDLAAWRHAKMTEDIAGTVNLLFALTCLVLGVAHRRLAQRKAPVAPASVRA